MIEYITYKKKKYPIRISYVALNGFKKDTGKSFDDMEGGIDLENYESLLFHALRSGAKAEEIEMPFEKKDIEDILDECMMEFLELIPKFFPEGIEGKSAGEQRPNRSQRRKTEKPKGK